MITIKDVAKIAGVGIGSVSRYLNNSSKMSEDVKNRIQQAIEETGYIRNELGRNLKTNNSRNVALLVPSVYHNFFSAFAFYVELELSKHDYKVIICNSLANIEKDKHYIDMLASNKISGIIGFTFTNIDAYITKGIPFISMDRDFNNRVTHIASDNYGGGKMAAKKLIDTGCHFIAFIGTHSKKIDTDVKFRLTGFVDYATTQHINYIEYTREDPILDYESFIQSFFDQYGHQVDGIFVENDNLALMFLMEARKRNLLIPNQLSIIGFDGNSFNKDFLPSLTTIAQNIPEISKVAVSELLNIIEKKQTKTKRIIIPVSLQEGDSTRR